MRLSTWHIFDFKKLFIRHFYSQFHDLGYKRFLFIPRQISNILYRQSRFPFLFRGFEQKIAHFYKNFNWINFKSNCLVLVIIWEIMFFCCDFYFFVCFRFKFKIFDHWVRLWLKILNLNLKETKKVKIQTKKNIMSRMITKDSCINR